MLNGWEIILIFTLALILFGAKKLPELARGLGQGIREFRKATQQVSDEIQENLSSEQSSQGQLPKARGSTPQNDAAADLPSGSERA